MAIQSNLSGFDAGSETTYKLLAEIFTHFTPPFLLECGHGRFHACRYPSGRYAYHFTRDLAIYFLARLLLLLLINALPLPTGVCRADYIGSFLRPAEVLKISAQLGNSQSSADELRRIEDKYVSDVAKKQLHAGQLSTTDGEFRRAYFHTDFLKDFSGVEVRDAIASEKTKDAFAPPRLVVTDKIQHSKSIQFRGFQIP